MENTELTLERLSEMMLAAKRDYNNDVDVRQILSNFRGARGYLLEIMDLLSTEVQKGNYLKTSIEDNEGLTIIELPMESDEE